MWEISANKHVKILWKNSWENSKKKNSNNTWKIIFCLNINLGIENEIHVKPRWTPLPIDEKTLAEKRK